MIVPFILLTLSGKSKAAVSPFKSITISPFYLSGETTILLKTNHSNLHFYVMLQNDLYMNIAIASGTITKPGTYTYKYDNRYTRSQNTVFIRYYTDDPTASKDSQHFSWNIAKANYMYLQNNEAVTTDQSLVTITSGGAYSLKTLKYTFIGFDGLYVPSYFHKIDLSTFRVMVSTEDKPFFSCKPELVIKNYNNVFGDIEGANETVTFPLKVVGEKLGYSLALDTDLYVDKYTLKMSSTQKVGYVKTKYIYLPINDMPNQDKYESYLLLKEFGIDKDMLIHYFELKALRNTFGDCSNSKYCIIRKSL